MQERRKTHIFPDLIFSKFFMVFCFFLFFVILFSLAKGTIRNYKVNSEIELLEQEIGHLEKQNQEFGQLIEYLNSDIFIEQEAKLKMGLKKEGENLIVIPNKELSVDPEEEKEAENKANPEKWLEYFFN